MARSSPVADRPLSQETEETQYDSDAMNDSQQYHSPHSVDELTEQNVRTILALEEAAKENRTRTDQIADVISKFCGSMAFVWVHIAWFVFWLGWNVLAPKGIRFDPYPFEFLTLVVSLEAIFLSTFILVSQNLETRLTERRNHLDLQINLLAEQENTKMLHILERIADKVGADISGDPDVKILEQAAQPERMLEQIDRTIDCSIEREEKDSHS
jgi:uncharacterized membrane protein